MPGHHFYLPRIEQSVLYESRKFSCKDHIDTRMPEKLYEARGIQV